LHDVEYDLLKKTEDLYQQFTALDVRLTSLRKRLRKIKTRLNGTIQLTDQLLADSYVPEVTSLEKIQAENAGISNELSSYHRKLTTLYRELTYQQGIDNDCLDFTENGLTELYEEYDLVALDHCQHYEVNTIDIVSLDKDVENFKGTGHFYTETRTWRLHHCEKVLTNYSSLNLETDIVLEVWKEFLKRCQLAQVLARLQRSQISASSN
jgi:hypothetical protein